MHLGLTFVLAALASPCFAGVVEGPAPNKIALAARAPATVSKSDGKVEVKCGGPCGTPFGNAFQNFFSAGATAFGAHSFTSFPNFFQSITTIQTTFVQRVQVWQTSTLGFQQFHDQVQLVIVQFYTILQPFIANRGCSICQGGVGFLQQFTGLFVQFLTTSQRLLQIISVSFSAFITQFDPVFALLTVCIRTAMGIVATLGGNVNTLIMGAHLNLGIFTRFQISINTLVHYSPPAFFGWGTGGFLGNVGPVRGGLAGGSHPAAANPAMIGGVGGLRSRVGGRVV